MIKEPFSLSFLLLLSLLLLCCYCQSCCCVVIVNSIKRMNEVSLLFSVLSWKWKAWLLVYAQSVLSLENMRHGMKMKDNALHALCFTNQTHAPPASVSICCGRLAYLWRASRGLFPRIYMQDKSPYPSVKEYIRGQVNETLKVWAKYSTPDTLILPYSLCQDNGTNFFSKVKIIMWYQKKKIMQKGLDNFSNKTL